MFLTLLPGTSFLKAFEGREKDMNLNEAKEKQMECKDCYWYSDVTVKCCERDGSEPCDPQQPICSEYEPKD